MITHIIFYLHILGAVSMGFYLLFPFMLGKIKTLPISGQAGYLKSAYHMNLISQFTLIAQLITGGYLISAVHVSIAWIIIVLILYIGMGACMGILVGKLRRTLKQLSAGQDAPGYVSPMNTLSYAIFALFILLLIFMVFA